MRTEVLPLRGPQRASDHACAVRPVLAGVLRSFKTLFAGADPGPDYDKLHGQMAGHAAALAAATGRAGIARAGADLMASCEAAAACAVQRQVATRDEIARLVSAVRDAVATLDEGQSTSGAELDAATDRLGKLSSQNDLATVKRLLAEEVVNLRRVAEEHKRQHDMVVADLREQLETAEEQLCAARTEALVDPVTEIGNRRAFDAGLVQRLELSTGQSPLILAFFDVDGFKTVNDQRGHLTGDAILRRIAAIVRRSVRQDDLVARIGGDEFALVASGLTLMQAEGRLRDIVKAIAAEPMGDEGVTVTVSCGAAEYCAGDTARTLQHRADAALGDAKLLGKNRIVTRTVPFIRDLLRTRDAQTA